MKIDGLNEENDSTTRTQTFLKVLIFRMKNSEMTKQNRAQTTFEFEMFNKEITQSMERKP